MVRWLLLGFSTLIAHLHVVSVDFVVLIPSYNNEKYCAQNLVSVLNQNYQRFRVIYVDDASTDLTNRKVKEIIGRHPRGNRVKLIRNDNNLGALANIYYSVHKYTKDDEVIVLVDGDDSLAHPNVLSRLAQEYSKNVYWVTYGQFKNKIAGDKGWAADIPRDIVRNKKLRSFPHVPTHLRTFKSWLFKKIKKEITKKNKIYITRGVRG